jgi:quercetin dioxygenase-like cupin family protein/DNA-binding Xre family transcriptional regulator
VSRERPKPPSGTQKNARLAAATTGRRAASADGSVGKTSSNGADAPELERNEATTALGLNLRKLRLSRNLSLNDVADGSNISSSFLSLVENGKSDITIGRLTRLIEFFGISITDLVPTTTPRDPDIVRKDERPLLRSPVEGIEIYLLTPDTRRAMMAMLLELGPGAKRAEYGDHPGEEFVHVIKGELELELEGQATRRLRPGDSAYYPGNQPHRFRNASAVKSLQIICVDTPPTF